METLRDSGGVAEELPAEGARHARSNNLPFHPHDLHRPGHHSGARHRNPSSPPRRREWRSRTIRRRHWRRRESFDEEDLRGGGWMGSRKEKARTSPAGFERVSVENENFSGGGGGGFRRVSAYNVSSSTWRNRLLAWSKGWS